MKKIIGIIASLLTLLSCSSVDSTQVFDDRQAAVLLQESHTLHPTQQMIKLALPNKQAWKKIDLSYGTIGTPVMLIPTNESTNHWTQSIRTKIIAYSRDPDASPEKILQQETNAAKSSCQLAQPTMISKRTNDLTYRINLSRCHNIKNQIQIGKTFAGKEAVYLVYYTAIDGVVNNKEITAISRAIETAQLVRDPRFTMNGMR